MSRDHLADFFWPDLSLERARRNLSWTLNNLTAHLPHCLRITAQSICFTPHPDLRIDSVQAAAWQHASDPAVRRQALDLFRGPFMDGFDFAGLPAWETWHLAQQELWRQRQERLFAQVIDDLCAVERYGRAVTYARRWVNLSPWVEEAHRHLMTCLAADGRPDLAMEQYITCRRVLREELDVDPAPETEALYRELQSQRSGAAARSVVVAGGTATTLPVFLTPLVGRRAEQEQLVRRLTDADYRLLSLVGAGGSGKTRLAVAAAARLRSHFGDGVVFVPCADVPPLTADAQADERLYGVLADALGLPQAAGKRRVQVARHLHSQHLLLVLDNFEHLVGEADFVLDLLTAAPRVSVLLTSRQPLGVTAEFVMPLAGLGVPDNDDWSEAAAHGKRAVVRGTHGTHLLRRARCRRRAPRDREPLPLRRGQPAGN
ncbi:MAG: BTAD domain-containing putative transcriptional regulator [Caldilineaceae bacterium]